MLTKIFVFIVISTTDFVGCVLTKIDPDHDLAILQLKDKKLLKESIYLKLQMRILWKRIIGKRILQRK